jgi:hypothetical protein
MTRAKSLRSPAHRRPPRPAAHLRPLPRRDLAYCQVDDGDSHSIGVGNILDRLTVNEYATGALQLQGRHVCLFRSLGKLAGGHRAGVFGWSGSGPVCRRWAGERSDFARVINLDFDEFMAF